MCFSSASGMSFMYIRNSSGPRTDPCGTEHSILHNLLNELSMFTLKFLSARKSFKYFIRYIGNFNLINLYSRPTCQTLLESVQYV